MDNGFVKKVVIDNGETVLMTNLPFDDSTSTNNLRNNNLRSPSFLSPLLSASAAIKFGPNFRIFVLKSKSFDVHSEIFDALGIDVETQQGVNEVYYRLSSTPRNMAFLLKYGISCTNQLG